MATLSQNVKQVIHDFDTIKDAIEYKGVEIPEGTHTSEYAEKIQEIETGIIPSGTIIIGVNGTIDVTQYASANVNVDTFIRLKGFLTGYGDDLNDDNFTIATPYPLCDYAVAGRKYIKTVMCDEHNGVRIIPSHCFYNCTKLESADFSNTYDCKTIRDYAFAGCAKLASLILPSIFPSPPYGYSLGDNVFNGCTLLTSADLSNAASLANNALAGSSLTTVYFSTMLRELGINSLAVASLTDIYYTGTQTQWETITGLSGAGIGAGVTVHYEYTSE